MTEDRSHQIQITRDHAQQKVDLYNRFEKLRKNTDFIKIVEEEYLEKEAIRLVHLKAHPSQDSAEAQKAIDNAIIGIGELRQFFSALIQEGIQMKKAIADCDAELELIHEELAGE